MRPPAPKEARDIPSLRTISIDDLPDLVRSYVAVRWYGGQVEDVDRELAARECDLLDLVHFYLTDDGAGFILGPDVWVLDQKSGGLNRLDDPHRISPAARPVSRECWFREADDILQSMLAFYPAGVELRPCPPRLIPPPPRPRPRRRTSPRRARGKR